MTIAGIFSVACMPLVALGLLSLAIAFWKLKSQPTLVVRLAYLAMALIGVPLLLLVVVFYDQTPAMVANRYILSLLIGAMLIAFPWILRDAMDQQMGRALAWGFRIIVPTLSVVLLATAAWLFVGDFLMPRQYVEDVVGPKKLQTTGKYGLAKQYRVQIGFVNYSATGEVYDSVGSGQYVRAEIGGGSQTIFRARQSSTPIWLNLPREGL